MISNIDKDLSKDDQQKAKEDIDEMFKGKTLFEMKDEQPAKVQRAEQLAEIVTSSSSEEQIKAKLQAIESREKQIKSEIAKIDKDEADHPQTQAEKDSDLAQTQADLHTKSMTTEQMKIYNDMSENIKKFSRTLDSTLYTKALQQRQSLADQGLPSSDIPMLHVETEELFEKGF